MAKIARMLGGLRPATILAGAWVWLVIYGFPGQMMPDSYEHLQEGRDGIYTDGHPPILDVLFKLCDSVVAGGFLIWIVQSITFLTGLYFVLRRAMTARTAAWLAAGLFVFPPVMLPFAAAWKDALMAGLLMLGIAGLLDERRKYRLWGLAAIALGGSLRYNAFAATLPLIVLLFELRPRHWLKRTAIALGVWIAITGVEMTANTLLVDRPMHYWSSSLAPGDICGVLAHLDEDLPDAELETQFEGTGLRVHTHIHQHFRELYTPKNYTRLVSTDFEPTAPWSLPLYGTTPAPEPQREALQRAWRHFVFGYPGAYLRHRFDVMYEVLSLSGKHRPTATAPPREFPYPVTTMKAGLSNRASELQLDLTTFMLGFNRWTPAFEPWMYALIGLLLLAVCRKQRDVFAIVASGLVIEASLLPLAPAPDYRYSHWMIVCTIVGMTLHVSRRVCARRGDHEAGIGATRERPVDAGAPRREPE